MFGHNRMGQTVPTPITRCPRNKLTATNEVKLMVPSTAELTCLHLDQLKEIQITLQGKQHHYFFDTSLTPDPL